MRGRSSTEVAIEAAFDAVSSVEGATELARNSGGGDSTEATGEP